MTADNEDVHNVMTEFESIQAGLADIKLVIAICSWVQGWYRPLKPGESRAGLVGLAKNFVDKHHVNMPEHCVWGEGLGDLGEDPLSEVEGGSE